MLSTKSNRSEIDYSTKQYKYVNCTERFNYFFSFKHKKVSKTKRKTKDIYELKFSTKSKLKLFERFISRDLFKIVIVILFQGYSVCIKSYFLINQY